MATIQGREGADGKEGLHFAGPLNGFIGEVFGDMS